MPQRSCPGGTLKLFAVVTFPEEEDKVAVVPLSWLTEDRAQCHWPPKRRGVRVEELVRDRVDPTAASQKYPVCLVARCSTLEKAERRATGAQYGLAADITEQSGNEDHDELEGGSSPVVGLPDLVSNS
ncbi:hypothetical protein MRX96_057320 [Rhipicephalus microplus]